MKNEEKNLTAGGLVLAWSMQKFLLMLLDLIPQYLYLILNTQETSHF
jgi:hypothetical protein